MTHQLGLDLPEAHSFDDSFRPARRETRRKVVRIVEYAPYPRATRDERRRVGFTRDESTSGMCLGVESSEEVGSLLRVVVRDLDDKETLDTLGRVAWCAERAEGQYCIGLDLAVAAGAQRMLKVRHRGQRKKVAVLG